MSEQELLEQYNVLADFIDNLDCKIWYDPSFDALWVRVETNGNDLAQGLYVDEYSLEELKNPIAHGHVYLGEL